MDKYGLVGFPLKHSFSKNFFSEKFQAEKIDAEYVNFEISSIDTFPQIISQHPNLRGLNVTIPYKEKVIAYLDELSKEAQAIGAVNVIQVSRQQNGSAYLKGFNSDVIGFTRSITPLLKPHHQKALILGTGGASKAVYYSLQQLGIATCYVSRRAQPGMLSYSELSSDILNEYHIVVNCTPVGMYPHTNECPELPYKAIGSQHLLYDLIYNPEETLFLQKGKSQKAITKNGLEMLILQAQASWDFWHNINNE